MTSTEEASGDRRRTWRWYAYLVFVALFIVLLSVGVWVLYTSITVSSRAERNLHATLFTIGLVEQFVHDKGRWPNNWSELEQMSFPNSAPSPLKDNVNAIRIGGAHGYDWPAQSPHLRECVAIDFGADPNTIIDQNPMVFDAIKPIGPYYEYRDYGHVQSLQETIKQSIVDGKQRMSAGGVWSHHSA